MNAIQFTSADELRAHYRALNARLNAPRVVETTKPLVRVVDVSSRYFGNERPIAPCTVHDVHDEQFKAQRKKIREQLLAAHGKTPIQAIIAAVGARMGFGYAAIVGPHRADALVKCRQRAMWICKLIRPDLSLVTIGKAFNRDHTTVMHGIRCAIAAEGKR